MAAIRIESTTIAYVPGLDICTAEISTNDRNTVAAMLGTFLSGILEQGILSEDDILTVYGAAIDAEK